MKDPAPCRYLDRLTLLIILQVSDLLVNIISKYKMIFRLALFLLIVGAAVLFGYWYLNGGSLGPRSFATDFLYYLKNSPGLFTSLGKVQQDDVKNNNILFLHHSVGVGFIRDGNLRQLLREEGYQLWDQGYRGDQLAGPDGALLGFSYNIPADNTDPDGFHALFSQKKYDLPLNGFSQVMRHDIIVLKSCYPVSYINDDAKLKEYQGYYLGIRDVMDQHPEKLFIILTQPPLNPAATDEPIAQRARELANCLESKDFSAGHQNIAVFDLFDLLAEPDQSRPDANMLREAYRQWEDSHPNAEANTLAAQLIADFISEKAAAFYQD
jgi:hypothetical protein